MQKYAMLACISAQLSAALVSSQAPTPTVLPYPYVIIVKPNDGVTICEGENCLTETTWDYTFHVGQNGCVDSNSKEAPVYLNIPSVQVGEGEYVSCTPSGCIGGDQNVIFTISNAYVTRSNIL